MNPQFTSPGGSVDSPCFTLIAKMDKRPPYLIATETGDIMIEILDTDSPIAMKIKIMNGYKCVMVYCRNSTCRFFYRYVLTLRRTSKLFRQESYRSKCKTDFRKVWFADSVPRTYA